MRTKGKVPDRIIGRRGRLLMFVVSCAVAGTPLLAAEAWHITGTDATKVATVENDSGFVLSVSAGPNRSALCELRLPPDATPPKDDSLPILAVDGGEPLTVLRRPRPAEMEQIPDEMRARAEKAQKAFEKNWIGDGGDLLQLAIRSWGGLPLVAADGETLRFECWRPLAGQQSPTRGLLRQMLDGESLTVHYATEAGESEESFSLNGAREAILEATALSAEPSRRDQLLEDLLEFRVHYRRTTCYVLGTRKRALGCLELVNTCAQRSHDSVLSMQECIDGR